jgi:hypothetical protein
MLPDAAVSGAERIAHKRLLSFLFPFSISAFHVKGS